MSTKNRSANAEARRKAKRRSKAVTWAAALIVIGAAAYGLSQFSPIGFDEDDIKVVNFSSLSDKQKRVALTAANTARCTCGCGLNLAQCVSTDLTCPIREPNIEKIKGMVREAQSGPET